MGVRLPSGYYTMYSVFTGGRAPFIGVAAGIVLLGLLSTRAWATLNGTFTISGDPESTEGATWTYVSAGDDGVRYDLVGKLHKPAGPGPFPAVIVNHGLNGSATAFVTKAAIDYGLVSAGLVSMGADLTHAGAARPVGMPDGGNGASTANIQRIHKVRELLGKLGYVDMRRVAMHGHSQGAYANAAALGVTTAAAMPADFLVASHTAGGINDLGVVATTSSQAAGIVAPYQMHHGLDEVAGNSCTRVPYVYDEALRDFLTAQGIPADLREYADVCHTDTFVVDGGGTSWDEIVAWYTLHGLFTPLQTTVTFFSQAAHDGTVVESSEDSNTGGVIDAADTGGGALRVGDDRANRQYKAIVSFDTSAIPDDATVVSAALRLTRGMVTGTDPFVTHGLCRVDVAKVFNGAAALEIKDFEAKAIVSNVVLTGMSIPAGDGAQSFGEIKEAGLSAINKTGRTQFRLYFSLGGGDNNDSADDFVGFHAGELPPPNAPALDVTYRMP